MYQPLYYERFLFRKTDISKTFPMTGTRSGGRLFIVLMCIAVAICLTKTKRWGWLWNEWLTSTDPKKIGTMYMIFASLMFFRGMVDAGMVWLQQSIAADSQGYLTRRPFSTDFYFAWRHHGFFRDDGIFLRAHELDCASSNRRARSGFPFLEFTWFLAHRRRRDAD